jgi:hypothetical protein
MMVVRQAALNDLQNVDKEALEKMNSERIQSILVSSTLILCHHPLHGFDACCQNLLPFC